MTELEKIEQLLQRGHYRKAVKAVDAILTRTDMQRIHGGRERYSFMTGDAYTYYTLKYPEPEILWIKNLATLMYVKAFSLNELGRNKDAVSVLTEAVNWDPVTPKLRFELCSNLIRMHEYGEAEAALLPIPALIMNRHDAALYYRKRGFLFSQDGVFEKAYDCMLYSMMFERNAGALKELDYICEKTGKEPFFSMEDVSDELIKKAAFDIAEKRLDFKLSPDARHALSYLYELYSSGGDVVKSEKYREELEFFDSHSSGCPNGYAGPAAGLPE